MTNVVFGDYPFRIRADAGIKHIHDPVRRKFVTLTPEEWVRQHVIQYLMAMGYSPSLMAVERVIVVNGQDKRYDIVVYNHTGAAYILVECKAPDGSLNQSTLMQVAAYNLNLHAPYCWITNGSKHYIIDTLSQHVLADVPMPSSK
jgi:hypothetical protein